MTARRSQRPDRWLEGTAATDRIAREALPSCGLGACLAAGSAGASFSAVLGQRYLIIVDTDPGAVSPYLVGLSSP